MSSQQTATPKMEANCSDEKSESCKIPKKSKDKFTDILTQTDARVAGSTPTLSESEKDKVVKQLQEIGIESDNLTTKSSGSCGKATAGSCQNSGCSCPTTTGTCAKSNGASCPNSNTTTTTTTNNNQGCCCRATTTTTPVKDCSKQTEKCKDCNCYKSRT